MLWWVQHGPWLLFVFCFGASVGSFFNVIVHRVPAGMSIVMPPSRCPVCGVRLRFFTENLPIIGWFMIRGKCRACGVRVSARYMLVEVAMALAYIGLYAILYLVPRTGAWYTQIGGAWWSANGFLETWPAFFLLSFLLVGLLAMTIVDAKTFTIPLGMPVFITVSAFICWFVQSLLPCGMPRSQPWPIHVLSAPGSLAGIGCLVGVGISMTLMWAGLIRQSFDDYEDYVEEGETLGDYPHARREMVLELAFLAPPVLMAMVGWWLGGMLVTEELPRWLTALGATSAGYAVGGGVIWAIRILGSLAFGREAMGMGDIHLLAAIGAVLGWVDPLLVMALSPCLAIAWFIGSTGITLMIRRRWRPLPFGPYLAAATLVVIVARGPLEGALDWYLGQIQPDMTLPRRGIAP